MTDQEIIEQLAREAMGWIVIDQHTPLRLAEPHGGYICDGTPKRHVRGLCFEQWNPLESIADAWMIVEKMADHHKDSFRLHSFGGKESQANFKFGGSSVIGTYTKADTAPRAICLAALSAIRSTDQQKGAGQ